MNIENRVVGIAGTCDYTHEYSDISVTRTFKVHILNHELA